MTGKTGEVGPLASELSYFIPYSCYALNVVDVRKRRSDEIGAEFHHRHFGNHRLVRNNGWPPDGRAGHHRSGSNFGNRVRTALGQKLVVSVSAEPSMRGVCRAGDVHALAYRHAAHRAVCFGSAPQPDTTRRCAQALPCSKHWTAPHQLIELPSRMRPTYRFGDTPCFVDRLVAPPPRRPGR
jgi:hypothetical protein